MATQLSDPRAQIGEQKSFVKLPAPTAWPIVLAFGITLLFAGLVTSASVSILGAILVGRRVCRVVPRGIAARKARIRTHGA